MKATPNLKRNQTWDDNAATYVSRRLFADKSARMFSQRLHSYPEEITVIHAPPLQSIRR